MRYLTALLLLASSLVWAGDEESLTPEQRQVHTAYIAEVIKQQSDLGTALGAVVAGIILYTSELGEHDKADGTRPEQVASLFHQRIEKTGDDAAILWWVEGLRDDNEKLAEVGILARRKLVEIDPDNAAGWVAMAHHLGDDPGGGEEMLAKAASARHHSIHGGELTREMTAAFYAVPMPGILLEKVRELGMGQRRQHSCMPAR